MTVSSTQSRISYATDDVSTGFAFPFYFQAQADLVVKLYEIATGAITDLALTIDYTISGTVDPDFGYLSGGTITTNVVYDTGFDLVIYRDPAALQELSISTSGSVPSKPIEAELDHEVMLAQRFLDIASRSVALPDGFSPSFDPTLPSTLALNPGSCIIIDPTGTKFLIGPNTSQIAAAAAAAASSSVYAWYGISGGTANAMTLTPATPLAGYGQGIKISFLSTTTNTLAATMNISGLGVKPLKSQSGAALLAGEITAGRVYTITDDGANFIVAEVLPALSIDTTKYAPNSVTNAKLAQMAAFTLKGNLTSGTTDPSDVSLSALLANLSMPRSFLSILSGSPTYNTPYQFKIPALSVAITVGSTYSDGTTTYTMRAAPIGAKYIQGTGSAPPVGSTLTRLSGAGDSPINFSAWTYPKQLHIRGLGAGGGGGGSGNSGGTGVTGTSTQFGTTGAVFNCNGGVGGGGGNDAPGGTGGAPTISSPAFGFGIIGSTGQAGDGTGAGVNGGGSIGGTGSLGGNSGSTLGTGNAGVANSGSGGSGGGGNGGTTHCAGGGAGAYVEVFINDPLTSYNTQIGVGGTGGVAGSSGNTGGAGGSGALYITEIY